LCLSIFNAANAMRQILLLSQSRTQNDCIIYKTTCQAFSLEFLRSWGKVKHCMQFTFCLVLLFAIVYFRSITPLALKPVSVTYLPLIILIEHQSTINLNMAQRLLMYIAQDPVRFYLSQYVPGFLFYNHILLF
jgi:hypothetical protein